MTAVTYDLTTDRLTLRGWRVEDASAALEVYGQVEVTRRLSPEMDRVLDVPAMKLLLQQWSAESARLPAPSGRWAVVRDTDGVLIGGAHLLPLPPGQEDLEVGWQLRPDTWGRGHATETMHALAAWAFGHDRDEVFAVVRPGNARALSTVRKNGMHRVGESRKYFGLDLPVFRLRMADLDAAAPTSPGPPGVD